MASLPLPTRPALPLRHCGVEWPVSSLALAGFGTERKLDPPILGKPTLPPQARRACLIWARFALSSLRTSQLMSSTATSRSAHRPATRRAARWPTTQRQVAASRHVTPRPTRVPFRRVLNEGCLPRPPRAAGRAAGRRVGNELSRSSCRRRRLGCRRGCRRALWRRVCVATSLPTPHPGSGHPPDPSGLPPDPRGPDPTGAARWARDLRSKGHMA